MQHYSDITTANAIGGTFAFLPTHKAKQKMQKSHQANAPRQTKSTDKQHTDKKGEPLTRYCRNGG